MAKIEEKLTKSEKPVKYFLGLTEEAPRDVLTIPTLPKEGAACFQKRTQIVERDHTGNGKLGSSLPGNFIDLFDDEYEALMENLKHRHFRWVSRANKTADVWDDRWKNRNSSRRLAASGDLEPISKYVWIERADSVGLGIDMRTSGGHPKVLAEIAK